MPALWGEESFNLQPEYGDQSLLKIHSNLESLMKSRPGKKSLLHLWQDLLAVNRS